MTAKVKACHPIFYEMDRNDQPSIFYQMDPTGRIIIHVVWNGRLFDTSIFIKFKCLSIQPSKLYITVTIFRTTKKWLKKTNIYEMDLGILCLIIPTIQLYRMDLRLPFMEWILQHGTKIWRFLFTFPHWAVYEMTLVFPS